MALKKFQPLFDNELPLPHPTDEAIAECLASDLLSLERSGSGKGSCTVRTLGVDYGTQKSNLLFDELPLPHPTAGAMAE